MLKNKMLNNKNRFLTGTIFSAFLLLAASNIAVGQDIMPQPRFSFENQKITGDAIATINGAPITKQEVVTRLLGMPPSARLVSQPAALRDYILFLLSQDILLQQAGDKAGIRESEEYKKLLKGYGDYLVRELYVQQQLAERLTTDNLKKLYETAYPKEAPHKEFKLRIITVENRDTALQVLKELEAGADFDALFNKYTPQQAGVSMPSVVDGYTGWIPEHMITDQIADEAMRLTEGGYSYRPFKTAYGWHILKLVDKRSVERPDFSVVQDLLLNSQLHVVRQQIAEELAKEADIKVDNERVLQLIIGNK